ncbi:MAG: amino acid adenylation domain-containing protein [Methylococcales bacterium]|nr:amino acid adenylation domain-containing protein [Methylococcales bacterium]
MLNKANLQDIYPLSPMQQGMLFHALHQSKSRAYFEQMRYEIDGVLDVKILKQSWQLLHNRHDVLRTVFVHNKSATLLQMVLKYRDVDFVFVDLSALDSTQQAERIADFQVQDRAKGFNLTKDRLSRVAVFKMQPNHHEMIWSVHHIILDAWCFGIIYNELMSCYQSLLHNQPLRLPPAPPFSRYIQWLGTQNNEAARTFWENYLQNYTVAVSLYAQQPHTDDYSYGRQKLCLSQADSDNLKTAVRNAKVTLNTAIQAAWALVLGTHNNCDDVVFGMTVSGRPAEVVNVENTVGLFINTVPLRIRIDHSQSLVEFWQTVQQQALITEAHHYYSLSDIQSVSALKQNLLNHVLVFENVPQAAEDTEFQTNGFAIKQTDMFEHPHYPFMLSITPDSEIELTLTYNQAIYSDVKIKRVAEQFCYLLEQMARQPNVKISELSILPESQRTQILDIFSKVSEIESCPLLLDLFEQQVCKQKKIALTDETQQLSYEELNRRANRFAHYLITNFALKAEDKVAILLPRNVDLVVALLGILKTGAAYLPLDTAYPKARVDYILEHSQAVLVVTNGLTATYSVTAINIQEAVNCCDIESNPNVHILPNQLAYLIYTSGSTGQPKGVMVEHGNLAAFCTNLEARFGFSESDKLLALTTASFDISILELLGALTVGIQVVIATDSQCQNPVAVIELIKTLKITLLQATPSRLQWLINAGQISELSSLRIILVGGEALSESLATQLKELTATQTINVYGPTEATIWSTCKQLDNGQLTIGTALAGEGIYILSPECQLQPVGIIGEIVIAGAGVSRGYWQDVERTHKAFTTDPFKQGQRMYATGDLGRWLENGEIECLGRNDDQVKIRGFRIELGEIEGQTIKHPAVSQAAVVNSGNGENAVLSVFVVLNDEKNYTNETLSVELRKHLTQWLPEFMIPSRFVIIENLPLNSNGKVDRKALVSMLGELSTPQTFYRAPRNDIERQVVTLWEQVLKQDSISIDDDFFSLGGNSINAIQLMTQLSKLYGKEIMLNDFWTHPNIAALTDSLVSDRQQSVMIPLNTRPNAQIVFCFPPISGFGTVFRVLAEHLPFACYSFDIVSDVDFIAYALAAVKKIQPQGSYILLGYSAGGNYAYHVAAALQAQGETVQALILVDSIRMTADSVLDAQEKEDIIELAMKESQLPATLDKTVIQKTMRAYLDFILHHPNQSDLTTDIFCLNAQEKDSLSLPSEAFSRDWTNSTTGNVTIHQGEGNHFQILAEPHVLNNAKIIQGILEKL